MKKAILRIAFQSIVFSAFAQITPSARIVVHGNQKKAAKDTTTESDTTKENKEPQYFYATAILNVIVKSKAARQSAWRRPLSLAGPTAFLILGCRWGASVY